MQGRLNGLPFGGILGDNRTTDGEAFPKGYSNDLGMPRDSNDMNERLENLATARKEMQANDKEMQSDDMNEAEESHHHAIGEGVGAGNHEEWPGDNFERHGLGEGVRAGNHEKWPGDNFERHGLGEGVRAGKHGPNGGHSLGIIIFSYGLSQ
jgi:hypothetical protein